MPRLASLSRTPVPTPPCSRRSSKVRFCPRTLVEGSSPPRGGRNLLPELHIQPHFLPVPLSTRWYPSWFASGAEVAAWVRVSFLSTWGQQQVQVWAPSQVFPSLCLSPPSTLSRPSQQCQQTIPPPSQPSLITTFQKYYKMNVDMNHLILLT